jgi:hypothetical protein
VIKQVDFEQTQIIQANSTFQIITSKTTAQNKGHYKNSRESGLHFQSRNRLSKADRVLSLKDYGGK